MNNNSSDKTGFSNLAIACIYAATAIFLGITIVANQLAGIPFEFFSRDPISTFNAHPLTGIQSNIGVIIWISTASICLFSCVILRNRKAHPMVSLFFFWSGIITLMLSLDDFLLIHEDLAYRYLEIGQKTVFAIYGAVVLWYVLKFRKTIPHSDHLFFILAIIFFGMSIGVDIIEHYWISPWRIFFEDGFKLFGIVSWSIFLIRECYRFTILA